MPCSPSGRGQLRFIKPCGCRGIAKENGEDKKLIDHKMKINKKFKQNNQNLLNGYGLVIKSTFLCIAFFKKIYLIGNFLICLMNLIIYSLIILL